VPVGPCLEAVVWVAVLSAAPAAAGRVGGG